MIKLSLTFQRGSESADLPVPVPLLPSQPLQQARELAALLHVGRLLPPQLSRGRLATLLPLLTKRGQLQVRALPLK